MTEFLVLLSFARHWSVSVTLQLKYTLMSYSAIHPIGWRADMLTKPC